MTGLPNEKLAFRPLRAGVGIVASTDRRWATLGLILDGAGRHWGLTARHALGELAADPAIVVAQGPWNTAGIAIAHCTVAELRIAPAAMDAVAFPLDAGIATTRETCGLGAWQGPPRLPVAGERVVKVGAKTGLTMGRVHSVNGARVEIAHLPDYPAAYLLSDNGDSGALWQSFPDLTPLALHCERQVGDGRAAATALVPILAALDLTA